MASPLADRSGGENPVDRYKLLPRLQILAAIGCVLIFLYALHFRASGEVLRILGVGILVAGAALLSGFLLGFIFGIPRVGSEKLIAKEAAEPGATHEAASGAQSSGVTPNSNLVEISDWLTKIMVGVGLVELNSIPGKLGKLSYYLGPALRPAHCDAGAQCADFVGSGQAAGLAIILFYFTLGFLWGYVWTRLYFQRDLGGLVDNLQRDKEALLDVLQREKQGYELILAAEASMNEGEFDTAVAYMDKALANNPQDGAAMMTKARILKRQAMNEETPEKEKLLRQALDYADRAIPLMPSKGEPVYNKACYQALLGLDKNEILGSLTTAFRLNPALRRIAAEDSDLGSMRQDADFVRLIGTT